MRSRISFSERAIEDCDVTLSLTMKMKDWRSLKAQLSDMGWPASDLRHHLFECTDKADDLARGAVGEQPAEQEPDKC